ncbi:ubiquinone biosynthesis accessory factor UbiJ [Marinicella rhabdoformis]|uniref:ubiquinone biosynthesis accessory factor UbiJ n=1 Tax=Marinicella rhabdoformis TaxID=2580566 RepID=UPI0012AEDF64|nr:SCP2 sterol-binding domain-containing protein [Marinicella rhabdoformis]
MTETDSNPTTYKTLPKPATDMMSRALAGAIKYDPDSKKKLKAMAGKVVDVVILPIDQHIPMLIHEDRIEILSEVPNTVDTTISGKPTALFAMSQSQHIPGLDSVSINGDATAGQFVADFLKQLKPDWEDAICDVFGDEAGYRISETLKTAKQIGSNFFGSFLNSSKEYFLYENQELVRPDEMEQFLDEVDVLKSDVARLEQKIAQILSANNP